jgi:hypothetical protein
VYPAALRANSVPTPTAAAFCDFAQAVTNSNAKNRYATMRDAASGVAVPLVTLGVRPLARAAARLPPAPRVLFVFGEHAREVITTEVGLWLGRLLLDDSGGSGGGGSSSKGNSSSIREWPELHAALERAGEKPGPGDWPATLHDWTRALLANLTIEIVPIESVGARRLVEGGELCVRKAAGSGVDLNRNWPFAWRADVRFFICVCCVCVFVLVLAQRKMTVSSRVSDLSQKRMPSLCSSLQTKPILPRATEPRQRAVRRPRAAQRAAGAPIAPRRRRRAAADGVRKRAQRRVGAVHALGLKAGVRARAAARPAGAGRARGPHLRLRRGAGGRGVGVLGVRQLDGLVSCFRLVLFWLIVTRVFCRFRCRFLADSTPFPLNPPYQTKTKSSYAHAKVPYPLTVEVYGSDGQGKLGAGQANRPLGEFAAENMTAAEAAAVASTARSRGGDNSGAAAGSAAGALAGFAAKLGLWNAGSGRLRRHRDSGGGAGEASAAAAAGRRLHHHQQQQQQRRRLLLQAADALESVGGGGVKLPAPCHHHQQQQQSSQGSVRSRRRLVQELASQPPPAAAAAVADAGADDAILAAYNKGDPSGRACFRMFNPLDSPTYRRVVGDWLAAFVVALRHVARHHHAAAAAGGEGGGG